ncbi:MAG: hypothetical protein GIW95_08900 [Candidatus Eremiobacteraeota bacterium]|nr:hypothetical protein [Candidatus Eremiobacteraeota bacterium]
MLPDSKSTKIRKASSSTIRRNLRLGASLLALVAIVAASLPVSAARPLLDKGQWDAYFALFARDVSLPWKPANVRLDTYSGAPVDFSVYAVDPADVIVAGQNRQPRAIDTSKRKALARWKFSPPAGLRFQSSDVNVPIGNQEGFYVVEAHRGDAVQQVWLNRTHIGLLTKESPEGLIVWAVDLQGGRALSGANVSFLVGAQLIDRRTDASGLVVWRDLRTRPTFALAEQGAARAFVSMLPQAPLPNAIVGMRVESAVVRAGTSVRFAGFARRRTADVWKMMSGDVRVTMIDRGRTLASTSAHLDAAGAFNGELDVPASVADGDYALLASAAGGVGGTSVHVDAAGDIALSISATCPCAADRDVPLVISATRKNEPAPGTQVDVEVVRTPHIVPPGASEDAPRWGTTVVYRARLATAADGRARVTLRAPNDGLDSTYGVRAVASGASATTRIAIPSTRIALSLEPETQTVDTGQPVAFELRGFDATDGAPAANQYVTVRLSHASNMQAQTFVLDARGRARVVFRQPSLGANLALAESEVDGRRASDAASVLVEPRALSAMRPADTATFPVSLDRPRYKTGEKVGIRANLPNAVGDALVTLEGARIYQTRLLAGVRGQVATSLDLGDPQGAVRVAIATVRDGAIVVGTAEVRVDGPGHPRATELSLDRAIFAQGESARATVRDGADRGGATLAIRIADGRESGPAFFDDAPAVLAVGGTTSQNSASENPAWHAYVAPARSKATDIFAAEAPRKVSTDVPSLGAAAPRTMLWRVQRSEAGTFDIPVPREPGRYVLSVLKISDAGEVGASSTTFTVR